MDEHLKQIIGLPLSNLVMRLGLPLIQAREITSLAANSSIMKSFRLESHGKTCFKGRYYKSNAAAQIAGRIHGLPRLNFLPELVGEDENVTVEKWIDGQDLAQSAPSPLEFRRAGQMLGLLHASPIPSTDDLDFTPLDVEGIDKELRRRVGILKSGGSIDAELERRILDRLMRVKPVRSRLGIVHRDLCPENLVRDRFNELYIVDNGLLTIGPIEEDLCRTRYRWPMSDVERRWFAAGYAEHADPADFLSPSEYWSLCVLIGGAYVHQLSRSAKVVEIVRQIGDLLRGSPESLS